VVDFQLVRASDNEIVVWNTVHGHIYLYRIEPKARQLTVGPFRNIAEAELDAASLKNEALVFATEEARKRRLLG
jgi:hypothetical protein